MLHQCLNVLTYYAGDFCCFYFESSANQLSPRFPVFRFLSAEWPAAVVAWSRLHLLDSGGGPRPALEVCSHGVFKTTWNPCQATRTEPNTCSCKWKYVHFGKERKKQFHALSQKPLTEILPSLYSASTLWQIFVNFQKTPATELVHIIRGET